MRVKELLNESSKLPTIWYHGGAAFEKFSTRNIGRGENNHILGKGIYFINDKETATRYMKYAPTSSRAVYTVEIRFSGLVFDSLGGNLTHQHRDALDGAARDLGLNDRSELLNHPNRSNMRDGRGYIGGIFTHSGNTNRALSILQKNRIQGSYERIHGNIIELAVFDADVISVKEKDDHSEKQQKSATVIVSGDSIREMRNRLSSVIPSSISTGVTSRLPQLARASSGKQASDWFKKEIGQAYKTVMGSYIGVEVEGALGTLASLLKGIDTILTEIDFFDYDNRMYSAVDLLEVNHQFIRTLDIGRVRVAVKQKNNAIDILLRYLATK